jgi:hypothetical protein
MFFVTACGGAAGSGVVVGKVGEKLDGRAQAVPHGGEVCLMQEALSDKPPASDKPMSEACTKAFKNDQLWRRAMVVLGAYGETLETVAQGDGDEMSGQVEAALAGVSGPDWIQVDASEKPAADAVAQLASHMGASAPKDDLDKFVKDAAPHVTTVCDGLNAYLGAQAKSLGELHADAEKKRSSKSDRRCGQIEGKNFCVGDSALDRVAYSSTYGQLIFMEANHADARDDVAGFCAAHKKLEEAATNGTIGKDETYAAIVEAIKSARGSSGTASTTATPDATTPAPGTPASGAPGPGTPPPAAPAAPPAKPEPAKPEPAGPSAKK